MVAVVGIDPKLVDDLEVVLAPVFEVHQSVIQRRAVLAPKGIDAAQQLRSLEDVMRDDFIEEAIELAVRQLDAVQRFEFFAEILFERNAVLDVRTINVLQPFELFDQFFLKLALGNFHRHQNFSRRRRIPA